MLAVGDESGIRHWGEMYQSWGETRGFFATQQDARKGSTGQRLKGLMDLVHVRRPGKRSWSSLTIELLSGVKPEKDDFGWTDMQQAAQSLLHAPRPPRYLMVAWAGMASRVAVLSVLLGGTMVLLSAIV